MSEIRILRGNFSARKLTLKSEDFGELPNEFKVIFTVKPRLDNDLKDSNAIIQKIFNFPSDFDEVDGNYETLLKFSNTDTTQSSGKYIWNIRFLSLDDEFLADSKNGIFVIDVKATQRQKGE